MEKLVDLPFAPYDDVDADDGCDVYGCDYDIILLRFDGHHGHVHGYYGLLYDDYLNDAFFKLSLMFLNSLFILLRNNPIHFQDIIAHKNLKQNGDDDTS